jgi:hypothetical protein
LSEKIQIQIEPDKKGERIIIAAFISELSPGKFRENVLKEALKANAHFIALGNPGGILGFSAKHNNQLSCHTFVPTEECTSEKLLASLSYLAEYSLSWAEALRSGQQAPAELQTRAGPPLGMRS